MGIATNQQSTLPLRTADGTDLVGTHFQADSEQFIVIANATAVPRGFYRRFAEYAQTLGINVVTVDYRGIGDSKRGNLKGFEMEYADWSRYDLASAVQYASERGNVWLVGHSLGGHAIGQLPQPNILKAAYVCGVGAGWHGWVAGIERYKVWALWNLVGPVVTRIYGYQPMSKFGLGEDIPMGAYRDWKKWCSYPHYFFDDPAAKAITDRFRDVTIPIAAANALDDLWAPKASREAFFQGYTNAPVSRIDLDPQNIGTAIGHMGYFRQSVGKVLWPQIIEWLGRHGLRARG
jgi:predicted alpha/beta hydrolase